MIVLILLALSAGALITLNIRKGESWSTSFSTDGALVVALVLALVAPVRGLLRWARGSPPLSDTTLAQAREDLAEALKTGWAREDELRRINDPWPLPVRWSGPAAGEYADIAATFTGLTSRRLVILGSAGAGKTALAIKLVRQLLETRQPGDPVPVILAAATWTEQWTMTDWVAGQLANDHPGLEVAVKTGTGDTIPLAHTLAADEVLPVIDGLDELTEPRRSEVIKAINAYGSDRPIVLTCRPAEYAEATAARPVARATLIELDRLEPAAVRAYLAEATEAPQQRWDPVFAALDTRLPLTDVLANPLMVWLARTVYEQGNTRPGELTAFVSRDSIEDHLLAGFIPAAYAAHADKHGFRCSPRQAQRWLGFLAARQRKDASQDIAWWRLCRAEPGWSALVFATRVALYTCVTWLAVTWALTRRGYFHAGVYTRHGHLPELLAGPLGRAVVAVAEPVRQFLPPDFNTDQYLRDLAAYGMFRAAWLAFIIGLFWGSVEASRPPPPPRAPRLWTASLRRVVLGRWVIIAILACGWWMYQGHREPIPVILSLWRTKLILIWIGVATVGWILAALAVPTDVSAGRPDLLLRRSRAVYLLERGSTLAMVATVWLWAGTVFAIASAALGAAGVLIVAMLGGDDAWPRYLEARSRLWARRRLPWRTMTFLADAHRRGVLRQSGAAYQFRHIRLQEQLAAGYSSLPPWIAPWGARIATPIRSAWRAVTEQLAVSRADTHSATVTPDTISGAIPPRSLAESIGQQFAFNTIMLPIMVGVTIVAPAISWYVGLGVLVVNALLVTLNVRIRIHRYRAGLGAVPSSWSVRMTGGKIHVMQNDTSFSLALIDIERVKSAGLLTPDGQRTEWTALQARLRENVTVPVAIHDRWLPLTYLSTKPQNRVTAKPTWDYYKDPQLREAVRWFPDDVLSPGLGEMKAATATEFIAQGTLTEPEVPWSGTILPACATALTLLLFGQSVLGSVLVWGCVAMLLVCLYRVHERSAMRTLPRGQWSVRITPGGIELEANGATTHLTRDDIAEVELRNLPGKRRNTQYSAIQVRRSGVSDWLPAFWRLNLIDDRPPTQLVAALHNLVGDRFGPRLTLRARSLHITELPVLDDSNGGC